LSRFFDLLGPDRCAQITHVSADAAAWIADVVAAGCPNAVRDADPYHVVAWATEALHRVRRDVWNATRGGNGGRTETSVSLEGPARPIETAFCPARRVSPFGGSVVPQDDSASTVATTIRPARTTLTAGAAGVTQRGHEQPAGEQRYFQRGIRDSSARHPRTGEHGCNRDPLLGLMTPRTMPSANDGRRSEPA
jgi:hypothetical protein